MINRKVTSKIKDKINSEKILLIQGAHKIGKTKVAKTVHQFLKENNEESEFIELEQERFSQKLKNVNNFHQYLKNNFKSEEDSYLFLDDFQYLENGINFISKLKEKTDINISIITSSAEYQENSSFKKNKDIFEIIQMYSLSWEEFLEANTDKKFQDRIKLTNNEQQLRDFYQKNKHTFSRYFNELLQWGSYPEIVTCSDNENKRDILGQIFHETIREEAEAKLNKSNTKKYLKFLQVMARSSSYSINHNQLSNQIEIHKRTLEKFIKLTKNLFLFSFVRPFYKESSNEITKMTKVFGNDFGIVNYLAGHKPVCKLPVVYEKEYIADFIFEELCRHEDVESVKFYRTIAKAEIDFVVKTKKGLIPVELNFLENEKKSSVILNNFEDRYEEDLHKSLVITRDKLKIDNNKVYLPASLISFIKMD